MNFSDKYQGKYQLILIAVILLLLPLTDFILPNSLHVADLMRGIFVFAILGLGLNIVTGYTGLLNLGVAGFMAIGAYTYSILNCDIYPFQVGFYWGILFSIFIGLIVGIVLGLPTLRLSGDYLAIVTLGFGEIIQDSLKNLDLITKGTQGINPLPSPSFFGYSFTTELYQPWYYLFLAILLVVIFLSYKLQYSSLGRVWRALRDDELAASCIGISPISNKLVAFAIGAGFCSLAGALWASHLGSSGEPGNYDFQVSIIALCIVIVGGIGTIRGVLLGALIMIGFNSIVLVKLSTYLMHHGIISTGNIYSSPNNWKYMIFGLALILMMRFRPHGCIRT